MGYKYIAYGQDDDTAEAEFWSNLCKALIRVLSWPVIAFLEVASIPWRISKDESDEYLLVLPNSIRQLLNFCLELIEADYVEDVKLVWSRVVSSYEVSISFLFQITMYNILAFIWQKYGFCCLYKGLERKIEDLFCTYCSGFYKTESGAVHTFSMTNILSPSFDIPDKYEVHSSKFPLFVENADNNRLSPIEHPFNCHFMMQLARLAYEHPAVVRDVVSKWNLSFEGCAFNECGGTAVTFDQEQSFKHIYHRPNAAIYVCSNESSLMITFRGPGASNLISWTSDATLARFSIEDIGEVHVGIYDSLFSPREDSLHDKVLSILSLPGNSTKSIFLTGHCLGGAMASVFATAVSRRPDVHARIRGIFTFGAPKAGNTHYSSNFDSKYSNPLISLRFVNASDIVPKCPSDLEYCHHVASRFITSFGNIVSEPGSVQLAEDYEDKFALFLGVYKIFSDFFHGTSLAMCGLRCCLVAIPGIFSGLAIEYEQTLRRYADLHESE